MSKKYKLDKELYYQTIWFIRRYYCFKAKYEEALAHTPRRDGTPGRSGVSDPTYEEAAKIAELSTYMRAIEGALDSIPEAYRAGIWNAVVNREEYPDYAGVQTWKRWRQRFIWRVAYNMAWI